MREEKIPKAEYSGVLKIAGMEIPCHVLSDGRRVLVQRKMINALGMARGSSSKGGGDRLAHFVSGKGISPYISDMLAEVTKAPANFVTPRGNEAYCYEATVLADLCDAVFEANKQGKLQPQQKHIAERCEILMRGFAKVGIIALVDEATGYQYVRDKIALQKILDQYLRADLAKWAKTFPDEFYENLFKLKGWQYRPLSVKRPGVVGTWTNDIVYRRLAPGVLKQLRERNPVTETGRRKHKYFQWLSDDYGQPALKNHLSNVIFLMKASADWSRFYRALQRAAPKYGDTIPLGLGEKEDEVEK